MKVSKIQSTINSDGEFWKDKMNQNPNMIEYGTEDAEVFDYGVFDGEGNKTTYVHMNSEKAKHVVAMHLANDTIVEEYTIGAVKKEG
jgi:(2Fe-2S) ferredoxin